MDGRHLRRRKRLGQAKTLYLPLDVVAAVDDLADEREESFSKLTAEALRAYYGIKKSKPANRIIRRTYPRGATASGA